MDRKVVSPTRLVDNICQQVRFPVVRHLISIPAGLGRKRLLLSVFNTLIGATMWNSILLGLGYKLRQNWMLVQQYSHELDMLVAIGLVAVTIWFVAVHLRRARTVGLQAGIDLRRDSQQTSMKDLFRCGSGDSVIL